MKTPRSRRRWLLSATALLVAPSLRAYAQPAAVRVGFLYFGSRQASTTSARYDAFVRAMHELGYIEGRNLTLEARFADGQADRVARLAAEMLRWQPAVIVATGSPTYKVLRQAANNIPVVVTVTVDPVAEGLAATLARPGGHFTGLTDTAAQLGPKHLELLDSIMPRSAPVAVLVNSTNTSHPRQVAAIESAAQAAARRVLSFEAQTVAALEAALDSMARQGVGGLILLGDTFFADQWQRIAELAIARRLPTAHSQRSFATVGGLLSYGHDVTDNFRRAAVFVDKIVKGAKPAELPFEQPTEYRLVVNLRTAKAMGFTVPQSLLFRADELIQ
jgi:putative ABC transport system substrate-binding protein